MRNASNGFPNPWDLVAVESGRKLRGASAVPVNKGVFMPTLRIPGVADNSLPPSPLAGERVGKKVIITERNAIRIERTARRRNSLALTDR
jgi:hypothetical protein